MIDAISFWTGVTPHPRQKPPPGLPRKCINPYSYPPNDWYVYKVDDGTGGSS